MKKIVENMFLLKSLTYLMIIVALQIIIANITSVNAYAEILTPAYTITGSDIYSENYNISAIATSDGLAGGSSKTTTTQYDLNLENAVEVRLWPSSVGNSCCASCTTYCTGEFSFTLSGPTTLTAQYNSTYGYYSCDLSNRSDWRTARITINQKVISARPCSNCGKASKYKMTVSEIYVYKKSPIVTKQPTTSMVKVGDTVILSTDGKYQKGYKWQAKINGKYVDIVDGVNANGSTYQGANTNTLTISNINALDDGVVIRGGLTATGTMVTYTNEVKLSVDVPIT